MKRRTLRMATAVSTVLIITGCSKEEPRPIESAPARQTSDAAFGDILNSQVQQPTLIIEPTNAVVDLDGDRRAKVTVKVVGGEITIDRVRILPKDALAAATTDCVRTLGTEDACTIEISANSATVPGSAVALIDAAGTTGSADITIVGTAALPEVETEPAETDQTDPEEERRAQLEWEALDAVGAIHTNSVSGAVQADQLFSDGGDAKSTIMAGTAITVTLLDPVLTGRDGTARASVSWPVYGGIDPHQRDFRPKQLLAANSLVTLAYSGGGADGRIDMKVLEVRDGHNRRLRPTETAIKDAVGQEGAPARIERRLVERSVTEFLSTGLAVLPLYLTPGGTTTTASTAGVTTSQSNSSKAAETATDRLTGFADEVTRELIDIKPRERLPRGMALTIIPQDNWVVEASSQPSAATIAATTSIETEQ